MSSVQVELVAVVAGVEGVTPRFLAAGDPLHLPAGPLLGEQPSLQAGMREFVAEQTGHDLGFVEQLYTFADAGRVGGEERRVSISYLGLTRSVVGRGWVDAYAVLPWEDRRTPDATARSEVVADRVAGWARDVPDVRMARFAFLWGRGDHAWRPELALQRYEQLWEAGLVPESGDRPGSGASETGLVMRGDHRRILATAVSRLRATLQYRPVVFEMMPDSFTLGRLQEVVEALAGFPLHTQNFRRLVEQRHELVEPTGELDHGTGGRPARLYRFRPAVFTERALVGTKLPLPRSR